MLRSRFRKLQSRWRRPGCGRGLVTLVGALALTLAARGQDAPPPATQPAETPAPETQPATEPTTAPTTAPAETQPAVELPTGMLSTAEVEQRISMIEAATDLADNVRTELLSHYRQTLESLRRTAAAEAAASEYRQRREQIPERLATAQAAATQPTTQPDETIPPDTPLDQLELRLTQLQEQLQQQQDRVQALKDEADTRAQRVEALPGLMADANARLQRVTQELNAPPAMGTTPYVAQARKHSLSAQKRAIETEIDAYKQQLTFYDAASTLLTTQRATATRRLEAMQAVVARYRAAVSDRREAAARAARQEAAREAETAPAPIAGLARTNQELAEERVSIVKRLDDLNQRTQQATARNAQLSERFKDLQREVEQEELLDVVGPALVRQRAELAGLKDYRYERRALKQEIATAQARMWQLERMRREISDIPAQVDQALAQLDANLTETHRAQYRQQAGDLLKARGDLIDALIKDYQNYRTELIELSTAKSGLQATVSEFSAFIETHVLWVRSTGPLHQATPPTNAPALLQLLPRLVTLLGQDARRTPVPYAATMLIAVGLLALRPRLLHTIRHARERVIHALTDKYIHTLTTLVATVLLAFTPGPLILGFIGLRLPALAGGGDATLFNLARALGSGLQAAAVTWFLLVLLRQLYRPRGLIESHFRWDVSGLRVMRRHLLWLKPVLVPASLIVVGCEVLPGEAWRDLVGRVTYIVAMFALALFAQRTLRPDGGVLTAWHRRSGTNVAYTRYLTYPLCVGLPILLAAVAAYGYYFTALQLTQRLLITLGVVFAVIIVHGLLLRTVLVAQRKLAIEQARKKRAAQAEARSSDAAAMTDAAPITEEELNVGTIGTQSRQLLRTFVMFATVIGVLWTWSDLLPALAFLDQIKLWSYTVEVAGASGTDTELRHITMNHALAMVVLAIVTVVLAKNIPGLLEIALLQRLPIGAGERFAITSIARYIIVAAGIIAAFGAIGVSWTKVQWLIAALSVGLGFGLQEILANFVSGVILLFERPIRIGDTVTVGDVSGTVTRIRIRATTITDWDRKELIIPNKEFITGQVINWSLSDPTLRVIVPVGIAYGSDTRKAEEILYEVARKEPMVLEDPAPRVLFLGFGDSALLFELRVYIATIDHFLLTKHVLHKAIDDAFRAAGIEISFPQRDIHIRSIRDGLKVTSNAPPTPADSAGERS
jgi:potassium efflux system protein